MASETPNKACMLLKANTVEIRDAPTAEVGKDDVLIRVEATGICGSDVWLSTEAFFRGSTNLSHSLSSTITATVVWARI